MSIRHIGGRIVAAVGLFLSICAISPSGFAQEVIPDFYKEPGIQPNRDYVNQHVTENIDPFTGSLQVHSVDVFLPGNGDFDLKVVRSFNNKRIIPSNVADLSTTSLAGLGWTVHFGRVLKTRNTSVCLNTDNGTAIGDNPVLELPDGSRQVLAFTGSVSPLMITAGRWRAECLGAGTGLSVYSPDGVRYDMTQQVLEANSGTQTINAWYTTAITDRNGNTATVSYAAAATPEIKSVTTSDGRTISFAYLDSGTLSRRISTITTGSRVWTYGYQAISGVAGSYFLTSVRRPDATTWQYAYNSIVGTENPNNYQMLRMTYPQGGTITYGYALTQFDATATAPREVVVSSKSSSDGGSWSYAYSPGTGSTLDTTTVTTPAGTIVYKHVGPNYAVSGTVWKIGLLMEKTLSQSGSVLQREEYVWDKQKISDENNARPGAYATRVDTETYAPILTQRTIVRDGVTYQSTFSNFDGYGNAGTVVEAGPNGGSRTTQLTYYINTSLWIVNQVDDEITSGVGSVTRTWTANGNLLTETRDGVDTSYTYTAEGDIATRTAPRGLLARFSNYFRGVPRTESHPEGVGISRVVSTDGNITSETNGEGQTTSFSYDGLNRLTRIDPPLGNATTISYTATSKTATRGGLQQITALDAFARTTRVTTGGVAIASSYDALGRRTFGSNAGSPTVGHSFQYDALGRVTRITHSADASFRTFTYASASGAPSLAVRDERGNVTTHVYRAYGDPDKLLVMRITAPVAAASVTIERNGRGLVTSSSQNGVGRTFHYDSRYFLDSTTQPEVGTTVYGRDDAGNMTSKRVGSSGTTSYEYDGRNRLSRVTYPNSSPSQVTNVYWRTDKLRTVTNAVATRTYGYDANQNLTTESLVVEGLTLAATYNYNANDQLASIVYPVLGRTASFSPDTLGRPTAIQLPLGSMLSAGYWPNGQIADVAFNGGSRVTYGQNSREWLSSISVKTGDGVTEIASDLSYDVAGNLTGVSDSVFPTNNRSFAYDAINRLTTINGSWGNGSVGYSGDGNITSYLLGAMRWSNYTYDANNRLASVTSADPGGGLTTSYSYDAYGNASPSPLGYVFDNASNLVDMGGVGALYDGTNSRIKVAFNGFSVYEFRSAHGWLLAEWRKSDNSYDTLKEHLFLAGKEFGEQQTHFSGADVLPSSWMFLQPDALGTPTSATWAGGGLLFKDSYLPYGAPINDAGSGFTQRAFAGNKQDKRDLIYMGGRYYDPLIGRFLSIDPQEADPSDIHSLNRYAYANNNPNRYVDPDGNSPIDLAFLAFDAIKLGGAIYTGVGVGAAAADFGLSMVGVLSPVPGTGQALKAIRTAEKVVEGVRTADHAVDLARTGERAAEAAKGLTEAGRGGKQSRLRELANDDKLGAADRGWIQQEINSIERGQRSRIRNPPGKDLAHERGREAAKGYDYKHSNLQDRDLHRLQHKYDDFGRANAERPPL